MDNPSAFSYSTGLGKNGKFNITDRVNNDSSQDIDCHQPSDGDLLKATNSESSYEAVALLTSENTFTQDRLNQALLSACRRGHKLLVQTLVRVGANIEHRDEHGNTPLMICAENGFMDIVQFLVSRHADVNAVNSVGNTALILSVRSAGAIDLTRFLVEQQDVDVHHENQDGHTALIRATQFMDVDTMRLLLEKSMRRKPEEKAYPRKHDTYSCFFNSRDQETKQQITVDKTGLGCVYEILKEHLTSRTSPLELAIDAGNTNSLNVFLDCQLSTREEKKRYVDSALKYLFENHYRLERFSSTDVIIIQKLIQYGANVNQYSGIKLLISFAVESGNFQVVELLLIHGAKTKGFYSREDDPLVIAAKIGCRDLIELLLKYEADIDSTDFSGSALDWALRNDHTECAKLLMQCGAKMVVKSALRSAIDHDMSKYTHFLFENYNCEIMDYLSQPQEVRKLVTSAAKQGNCEIIGQILDAVIDIKEVDLTGQTPLMASKNREVAGFLIQRGADINQEIEGRNGSDAILSYVIKNKDCRDKSTVELCKVLIDNGALVNCRSGDNETPLMMIVSQVDCVDMLQLLLDNGADVNDKDSEGNTALFHAVRRDNSTYVTCLIDSGASVNCRNEDDRTLLMMIAAEGDCVDMLKMLLDNGADINDNDDEGNTALFHAVRWGNNKTLKCLVDCSKDKKTLINCQNKKGKTPLIFSVKKGYIKIMKELIENGADVNIKDNKEKTALHHLLLRPPRTSKEILTSLLEAGSHVNWQNTDGFSPLMIAAMMMMPSMMPTLLDAGADVNAVSKGSNSQTALSFLCDSFISDCETHFDKGNDIRMCFETLLDADASCSYLSHECFHKLIIKNHVNVILKFIQHGVGPADVDKTKIQIGLSSVPSTIMYDLPSTIMSDVPSTIMSDLPSTVSPLGTALLFGKIHFARYFVDILFLTLSDLSMFASTKVMECFLQQDHQKNSLRFLHEVSSQPMTLMKLSLVTVSAAVGSFPGRETRVDSLPLPQMMKDKLLFKSVGGEHAELAAMPSEYTTEYVNARLVRLMGDRMIEKYIESCVDIYSDTSDSDDDGYELFYNFLMNN